MDLFPDCKKTLLRATTLLRSTPLQSCSPEERFLRVREHTKQLFTTHLKTVSLLITLGHLILCKHYPTKHSKHGVGAAKSSFIGVLYCFNVLEDRS